MHIDFFFFVQLRVFTMEGICWKNSIFLLFYSCCMLVKNVFSFENMSLSRKQNGLFCAANLMRTKVERVVYGSLLLLICLSLGFLSM